MFHVFFYNPPCSLCLSEITASPVVVLFAILVAPVLVVIILAAVCLAAVVTVRKRDKR